MSETTTPVKTIGFPPKLIYPLMQAPERNQVLYGGRAGGKSWGVSLYILTEGMKRKLRALCTREYMSSVRNSLHQLFVDHITEFGLESFYTIEKAVITGKNGTQIFFAGIQNDPDGLKSYEGVEVTWCEEAENITKRSWEVLIPTVIRRFNSKIIVTFNPRLASSETYQRWVANPPPNTLITKINYLDNPFLWNVDSTRPEDDQLVPSNLGLATIESAEYMKRTDIDSYNNIWLGEPRVYLDDAVYGPELRIMEEDGRIMDVPYDPSTPVHTFWDLGWEDFTCIIFAQKCGFNYHIIDFYVGHHMSTPDYIRVLQRKPYIYGIDYLPHDANSKNVTNGRSIKDVMRSNGREVKVIEKGGAETITIGIDAARVMFPRLYIDKKKCVELIDSLRGYCWDIPNEEELKGKTRKFTQRKPTPIHGDQSHAADAFRCMAMSLKSQPEKAKSYTYRPMPVANGWMA